MRIERLTIERNREFMDFCVRNSKMIQDTSLLRECETESFYPDCNNPTYIVIDNNDDRLVATASLVIDDHGKSSFSIFYSAVSDAKCYELLMKAILTEDLCHLSTLDELAMST